MIISEYEGHISRLYDIMRLEKGWLNGDGEKVTKEAFKKAHCFLFSAKDLAEYFHIYPTPEGGISFEIFIREEKKHILWKFLVTE